MTSNVGLHKIPCLPSPYCELMAQACQAVLTTTLHYTTPHHTTPHHTTPHHTTPHHTTPHHTTPHTTHHTTPHHTTPHHTTPHHTTPHHTTLPIPPFIPGRRDGTLDGGRRWFPQCPSKSGSFSDFQERNR